MAVDPNTGQTVLNIPGFDQRYAGFLDPNAIAGFASGQGQADQMGALGQSLMQRGYIPNSGFAGALAQMAQSAMGSVMLKKSQEQMAGLYQQQIEAANKAAQAKRAQDIQDERDKTKFGTDEDIRKVGSEKEAEIKLGLQYGDQTTSQAAKLAGAKAAAEGAANLPNQEALAKYQKGLEVSNRESPFKDIDEAVKQGAITPEQAMQAKQAKVMQNAQALSPRDQAAIDKRIPVVQDQLNKIDSALQIAQEMKEKMHSGGYASNSAWNANAPDWLKSTPAQQLGTDSGNLILAAQSALQGAGNRGSVAQLKILQSSKPNVAQSNESQINAIDKITAELERAKKAPAAELEHYGNGGTPTSWAAASTKLSAQPSGGGGKLTDAPPDGTHVQGPDGKVYVVQNGQPVPVQ